MQSDLMLLDEERHAAALESLSLQRLAAGNLTEAFRLADRRCRISPLAKAHHYTLRGEISHQLDDLEAAIADVARALELAPNNIAANRRMLAWSEGPSKVDSARRLLDVEYDLAKIPEAIEALRQAGQSAFAAAEWTERTVTGWAVWGPSQRVQAIIESDDAGSRSEWLVADPRHPLASDDASATGFSLARPASRMSQRLALYADGQLFYQKRLRANVRRASHGPRPRAAPSSGTETVTVILPVYGDFEATQACLDSLLRELERNPDAGVIIIDDASPDAQIKQMLQSLPDLPNLKLITNAHNLGFAESVNRGLEETKDGDIVFLNADTVVPPGFLTRLKAAAHSASNIGTLTPLSNNGEFTSFPVPFRSNPIGTYDEICAIDAAAARANANLVIDLPNGIGFCLYVTRACLDAVGRMSDAFSRGYYEDVDFCLRASESGFRNVCAAGVFVGHAGSRSFGAEKRSLVVRNLETIEQWFPKYRLECAAFVQADPLRRAREAIERSISAESKRIVVLICSSGVTKTVTEARAQSLVAKGGQILLVEFGRSDAGPAMKVANPSNGIPQSIVFELAVDTECEAALDYLRRIAPVRIEIADTANIPPPVLDAILQLKSPVDLLIADGGLLCPRGAFKGHGAGICDAPRNGRLCDECLFGLSGTEPGAGPSRDRVAGWERLLNRARYIYAADAHAKSFAAYFLGRREVTALKHPTPNPTKRAPRGTAYGQAVGFVTVGGGITEFKLMKYAALAINRAFPERPVVVIGDTIDDLALMKLDNIYVTGAVEADEYDRVLQQYAVGKLFVPVARPLFGHPTIVELSSKRPTAFFDWSLGEVPSRPMDLALDPYLTDEEFTTALVDWISQGPE